VHFVTRLKDNATYVVVERRTAEGDGVRADEVMVLEKQAHSETAPILAAHPILGRVQANASWCF